MLFPRPSFWGNGGPGPWTNGDILWKMRKSWTPDRISQSFRFNFLVLRTLRIWLRLVSIYLLEPSKKQGNTGLFLKKEISFMTFLLMCLMSCWQGTRINSQFDWPRKIWPEGHSLNKNSCRCQLSDHPRSFALSKFGYLGQEYRPLAKIWTRNPSWE